MPLSFDWEIPFLSIYQKKWKHVFPKALYKDIQSNFIPDSPDCK